MARDALVLPFFRALAPGSAYKLTIIDHEETSDAPTIDDLPRDRAVAIAVIDHEEINIKNFWTTSCAKNSRRLRCDCLESGIGGGLRSRGIWAKSNTRNMGEIEHPK